MAILKEIKTLPEVPLGKTLVMLISYAANLLLNVPYSFSAFADATKAQFNMTQMQATIAEATLTSTSLFFLPASLIYNATGIVTTSLVFLLVTILGSTSMWLCILMRSHLIGYPAIIPIVMAIAGHARAYLSVFINVYLTSLISSEYRPFVLMSSDLTQQMGIFLTSLTYEALYIDGHVVDAENQHLESFFLHVLIIYIVISSLLAVAIPLGQQYQSGNLKANDESGPSTELQEATQQLTESSNKKAEILDKSSSPPSRFPLPFLLILTSTSVPIAILYLQSFNISYMTGSLSLIYLNYFLITSYRICIFISKIFLYLVVSWGRKYTYINEIISVTLSVLMVIIQILYLVKGTDPIFFCVSYIMSSALLGGLKLFLVLLLNTYYENDNYGFKFSFAWSLICVLLAVLQVTFGALYDSEIPAGGGQYCYGSICLSNTFILTTLCSVIAPISSIALFYAKYRTTMNENET